MRKDIFLEPDGRGKKKGGETPKSRTGWWKGRTEQVKCASVDGGGRRRGCVSKKG